MLTVIIDTIAKRYGWTYLEITENMYWEDVYRFYEYASNMDVSENNENMKFNFLIHAQTENAFDKWTDLDIPFPDIKWKPKTTTIRKEEVFERATKRIQNSDPAVTKRFEEIIMRVRRENGEE